MEHITDEELENVIACCGIELDCKDCPFYMFGSSHCLEYKQKAEWEYIQRLKDEIKKYKYEQS